MELKPRQRKTLENLKAIGITEPMAIIKYCVEKLAKPRYGTELNGRKLPRSQTRKHTKGHYQGIINYLAQQPSKLSKKSLLAV